MAGNNRVPENKLCQVSQHFQPTKCKPVDTKIAVLGLGGPKHSYKYRTADISVLWEVKSNIFSVGLIKKKLSGNS